MVATVNGYVLRNCTEVTPGPDGHVVGHVSDETRAQFLAAFPNVVGIGEDTGDAKYRVTGDVVVWYDPSNA